MDPVYHVIVSTAGQVLNEYRHWPARRVLWLMTKLIASARWYQITVERE